MNSNPRFVRWWPAGLRRLGRSWSGWVLLLVAGISVAPGAEAAEAGEGTVIINERRLRLGPAGAPEWESLAGDPPVASQFEWKFQARSNHQAATLFVRQDEVRQDWGLELNGRRLGTLFLMEADLTHHWTVPPGALRDGENVLSIRPPRERDDIILHEVRLEMRPPTEAIAEGTLTVTLTDEKLHPVPGRITIVDSKGSLAPLIASSNAAPMLAVRPGVIYTGNGRAEVGLRAGRYTVYASRGFEWSVATQHVEIVRGQPARVPLPLQREVPTPGLVSCDTHVHTFTFSRHGDATADERMLTLAGEGIELPVATEHNLHVDPVEAARRMGVGAWLTPVAGNEVTTPAGHFNIFPVRPDARVPDFKLTDWPRLMSGMRATPDVRVVVLNHPRNVHNDFQPFASTNFNAVSGENLRGPKFTFDAMELLNSSAQQSDHLLVLRDWFALLNHGYRITAVGSSDSHDVSRYIVGQGRTYIACPDADPGRLDVATACSNLLAGRALVSMGLLAELTVNDRFRAGDLATVSGDSVRVEVRVLGPSWVSATNVALFANGVLLREQSIDPNRPVGKGMKAVLKWTLPRPAQDVHLVVMATGPDVTAPYWAIPKPYQPTSTKWVGRVMAVANPVWLDADGDGTFTSARGLAGQLLARHGTDPVKLLPALDGFDEATAAQAASLCAGAGVDRTSEVWRRALERAAVSTQRGFSRFGFN